MKYFLREQLTFILWSIYIHQALLVRSFGTLKMILDSLVQWSDSCILILTRIFK
jgi:hypothetical protein